jgi:hypothetical protein
MAQWLTGGVALHIFWWSSFFGCGLTGWGRLVFDVALDARRAYYRTVQKAEGCTLRRVSSGGVTFPMNFQQNSVGFGRFVCCVHDPKVARIISGCPKVRRQECAKIWAKIGLSQTEWMEELFQGCYSEAEPTRDRELSCLWDRNTKFLDSRDGYGMRM